MIGGQERQSGRTPWRAAGLCGGANPSTGSGREDVPGAGMMLNDGFKELQNLI